MEIAPIILEFLRLLIWPVTVFGVLLLFRRQVLGLLDRIWDADPPGGFAFDLDREIKEAKALSAQVQEQPVQHEKQRSRAAIPLTEANARMVRLALRPSPSGLDMSYYRTLAEQDPNVALAGLRIELNVLARNLAKGFDVESTTATRDPA